MVGPEERYRVALEVLTSSDGRHYARYRVDAAEPLQTAGQGQRYLAVVDEQCALEMNPGESGLMLRSMRLMGAKEAVVRAVVTAGPGAPDWLPTESRYLLFDGDRTDAAGLRDRYIPFAGLTAGEAGDREEGTPLERLAVAVGRSVARANATLARSSAQGGVALVAGIRLRIAVEETGMAQGRVLVTLARPTQGQTGQFVEFTMTTVPGAEAAEDGEDG